jgi:carbon storage regulator
LLVLTRKSGESIFIDGKIKVSVIEVKGGAVKLGIEAPDHVLVYRGEIFEKILEENKKAATSGISDLDELVGLLPKRETGNKTIRRQEK